MDHSLTKILIGAKSGVNLAADEPPHFSNTERTVRSELLPKNDNGHNP